MTGPDYRTAVEYFRDKAHAEKRAHLDGTEPNKTLDEMDDECDVPPFGWRCTRGKNHEGPCAAIACPEDIEFVESAMKRLRERSE